MYCQGGRDDGVHRDLKQCLRWKERPEAGEAGKGRAMWDHVGLGGQSFYDSLGSKQGKDVRKPCISSN